jgi:hypothetical protein
LRLAWTHRAEAKGKQNLFEVQNQNRGLTASLNLPGSHEMKRLKSELRVVFPFLKSSGSTAHSWNVPDSCGTTFVYVLLLRPELELYESERIHVNDVPRAFASLRVSCLRGD